MGYQKALSKIEHNCTNPNGHIFSIIKDRQKIENIRKQYPQMKCALWECSDCSKITESM